MAKEWGHSCSKMLTANVNICPTKRCESLWSLCFVALRSEEICHCHRSVAASGKAQQVFRRLESCSTRHAGVASHLLKSLA